MLKALSIFVLFILTFPVSAGNLIVNGDFEIGDLSGTIPDWWGADLTGKYPLHLVPGWTEASLKTVRGWSGSPPVPVQLFCADAPMYVHEISYSNLGDRLIKRTALAGNVAPKAGYSAGWALSGNARNGKYWISQTVKVTPGKYMINASWDALACNQSNSGSSKEVGAVFAVFTDERLARFADVGADYINAVWSPESKGKWISRKITNKPITTKTGFIEICLLFLNTSEKPIPTEKYSYVSFDNISFDLLPAK